MCAVIPIRPTQDITQYLESEADAAFLAYCASVQRYPGAEPDDVTISLLREWRELDSACAMARCAL